MVARSLTLLLVILNAATIISSYKKNVICFYTNWAQYRRGLAKFMPSDINVKLCSHITYAHLRVDQRTHKIADKKNDEKRLAELVGLKKKKRSLKIIASVGGWSHEKLPRFHRMVHSRGTRRKFIRSMLVFLVRHRLDGISIDWEYPNHRGNSGPGDIKRYTYLLKEIKQAFKRYRLPYTLSASVSADWEKTATSYQIRRMAKYVDWINVMTYALHGAWEKVANHHTAMYGDLPTVEVSLDAWRYGGMPDSKINLGLATYGRSYTLKSSLKSNIGDFIKGAGKAGKYTRSKGVLSYYEYCDIKRWDKVVPWKESLVGKPYAVKGRYWVGIDTPASIKMEVDRLVNKYCLHGIAIWSLGYDDFTGAFCNQGRFPLVSAAVKAMKRIKTRCKARDKIVELLPLTL